MNVASWNNGHMQLKCVKKSWSNDNASALDGRGLYTRRWNMSPKTSGLHWIHLLSSIEVWVTISWNDLSPVFSLTHWTPFGEKIEKPEEDPRIVSNDQIYFLD
jgi:hypothetical protein